MAFNLLVLVSLNCVSIITAANKDEPKQSTNPTFLFSTTDLINGLLLINHFFNLLPARRKAFDIYERALQRQVHNLAWAIGYNVHEDIAIKFQESPEILQMVNSLAQVLDGLELQNLIVDSLEGENIGEIIRAANIKNPAKRKNEALYGLRGRSFFSFALAPISWVSGHIGNYAHLIKQGDVSGVYTAISANTHNTYKMATITARDSINASKRIFNIEGLKNFTVRGIFEPLKRLVGIDVERTILYPISHENMLAIDTGIPSSARTQATYQFNSSEKSFPVEKYHPEPFAGEKFDPEKAQHLTYLKEVTSLFASQLQSLKNIDHLIVLDLMFWAFLKSVQFFLKDRPYAGLHMSTIAQQKFMMSSFLLSDEATLLFALCVLLPVRSQQFNDYHATLQRMLHNVVWSVGFQEDAEQADILTNTQEVGDTLITVAPVLENQQVKDLIADPLETVGLMSDISRARNVNTSLNQRAQQALYGTEADYHVNFALAPLWWLMDLGVLAYVAIINNKQTLQLPYNPNKHIQGLTFFAHQESTLHFEEPSNTHENNTCPY